MFEYRCPECNSKYIFSLGMVYKYEDVVSVYIHCIDCGYRGYIRMSEEEFEGGWSNLFKYRPTCRSCKYIEKRWKSDGTVYYWCSARMKVVDLNDGVCAIYKPANRRITEWLK